MSWAAIPLSLSLYLSFIIYMQIIYQWKCFLLGWMERMEVESWKFGRRISIFYISITTPELSRSGRFVVERGGGGHKWLPLLSGKNPRSTFLHWIVTILIWNDKAYSVGLACIHNSSALTTKAAIWLKRSIRGVYYILNRTTQPTWNILCYSIEAWIS